MHLSVGSHKQKVSYNKESTIFRDGSSGLVEGVFLIKSTMPAPSMCGMFNPPIKGFALFISFRQEIILGQRVPYVSSPEDK